MLDDMLNAARRDIDTLMTVTPVPLGIANPPPAAGVYMLLQDQKVMYVGEALGRKGLRDRLGYKHLSGDEGHAVQRAFAADFPDRELRREHMRKFIFARWLPIDDPFRASVVERILIALHKPPWNRK